jgi:hypothetical protein
MPRDKSEEFVEPTNPKIDLPKEDKIKTEAIKEPKLEKLVEASSDKPGAKLQVFDAPKLERSKEHQAHDKARASAIDKLRKFVVKSVGLTEEEFNTLF